MSMSIFWVIWVEHEHIDKSILWAYYYITHIMSQSRSEPNPNIKGKRSFVPKIWKSVTFCDILWHFQMSQCHTFELCDISRFLSHGMYFFLVFLAKPKMSKKCTNVTNVTNPQLVQGSFRTFRKYLRFEVTLRCRLARTNPESWYWPCLRSRFGI